MLPLRLLLSPPLRLLCVLVSLPARIHGNLSQMRPGPERGSASAGQKFSPRLASSPLHMSSGPFWTEEKRRRGYDLGPRTPRLPLPHEVIQMLAGEPGREERDSWWVRGGRAGRALAGPHPVALIHSFLFFPPSPLICRCCHSNNPAFIPSLTPSFLYLFYLLSLIAGGAACESR